MKRIFSLNRLKSKKAQGLPMQTIVIIIILIVVLAAVLIFFFSTFGEGKGGVDQQNIFARCSSLCAEINSKGSKTSSDVITDASNAGYCSKECHKYTSCFSESANCLVDCDASGNPTCT